MMHRIQFLNLLGVPLLCGALLAIPGALFAGSNLSQSVRLIIGLSPDTKLAVAWEEGAKRSAEVAQESPLAIALRDLVGMPIRDIRLGSGRTVSFAPDWNAMGGVEKGDRLVFTLNDVRLANALATRLDSAARSDEGTTMEIDPARTIAAIAARLSTSDLVAYAQPDTIVGIDK